MFKNNILDEIENEMDMFCGSKCVAVMKKPELEIVSRIPVADMQETGNSVIATFELPGVAKEDIQLNVAEDRVEVKVEKKAEKEIEEKNNYSYEMRSHSFYGALPLPSDVIAENAEASYKDGILRVEIPKAKKVETKKRIEIK
ncbi:Hsp20/alpha crystallin family protein [Candidatus Woesearchaeota archaeon]|nr:Hsp20/alpha crystallin family protein [Candidatus Woesearchaeota archaeon]